MRGISRKTFVAVIGIILSLLAIASIWTFGVAREPTEREVELERIRNIPGVEFVGEQYSPFIFPVDDLPLIEQENRFERFLLALQTRAEATGDQRLADDVMTMIRLISCGDVQSFLAECPGLGIVPRSDVTVDSSFWITELSRYRKFFLRLRFDHDEIVIRDDPGSKKARDTQGQAPDIVGRLDAHHPFIERIPEEQARHVEVLLPFTYVSAATSTDTYGCLGLVMMWNPEVSRWVLVEYRNYQDPGQMPISFPHPTF